MSVGLRMDFTGNMRIGPVLLFAWLIIGLVIYFLYSRKHSEFSSLS